MSTLILEDLNLVTLNELLQRLPAETKVGALTEVIGERELFLPEQANKIVAHFSLTEESAPREFSPLKETGDLIQLIRSQRPANTGNERFVISLKGILPNNINQSHQILVEVVENNVLLTGYNPSVGNAFWYPLDKLLTVVYSEGKLHQIREQIVLHYANAKCPDCSNECHCS